MNMHSAESAAPRGRNFGSRGRPAREAALWMLPLLLALSLTGAGCTPPLGTGAGVDVRVEGLPPEHTTARVLSLTRQGRQVLLEMEQDQRRLSVRLEPWPEETPLPECAGCTADVGTRRLPDGVRHRVEFQDAGGARAVFGNGYRQGEEALTGWKITRSRPIRPPGGAPPPPDQQSRVWVSVALENDSGRLEALPGQPVVVNAADGQWEFILLGAFIPGPPPPAPPGREPGRMVAPGPPPPRIADLPDGLRVDWVAIRKP